MSFRLSQEWNRSRDRSVHCLDRLRNTGIWSGCIRSPSCNWGPPPSRHATGAGRARSDNRPSGLPRARAILLGILGATCLALLTGDGGVPRHLFRRPGHLRHVSSVGFFRSFQRFSFHISCGYFRAVFAGFVDSVGTVVGVGKQAGLVKDGKFPQAGRALFFQRNRYRRGSMPWNLHGGLLHRVCGRSFRRRPDGVGQHGDGRPAACGDVFQPAGFPRGRRYRDWTGRRDNPILRYPILAPALIVVGLMMMKIVRHLPWGRSHRIYPGLSHHRYHLFCLLDLRRNCGRIYQLCFR